MIMRPQKKGRRLLRPSKPMGRHMDAHLTKIQLKAEAI